MNIPKLREIQEAIRQNPEHFNMRRIITRDDCGTQGCIGGFCLFLNDPNYRSKLKNPNFGSDIDKSIRYQEEEIQKILDLTQSQVVLLLYGLLLYGEPDTNSEFQYLWPHVNAIRQPRPLTKEEIAELACRRIDRFIETDGEE